MGPLSHIARSMRRVRLAAGLLGAGALVLLAADSRADISRKVDESGVISFSNSGAKRTTQPQPAHRAPSTGLRPLTDRSPDNVTRFDPYIREAAALYQIPEELVRAVIKVESGFDPRAVSHANARGLMQLIPETAARMTVTDIFDPRQNIFGGVRYLRVLANVFNGDIELTLAGYNAGEHAVIRHGGIPPYPETQQYVVLVLSHYHRYRAQKMR